MEPSKQDYGLSYNPDLIDRHLREARKIRARYLGQFTTQMFTALKNQIKQLAKFSHRSVNGAYRVIDPQNSGKPGKRSYT